MPECRNCGGFVTGDFARVFGNNENEVYGCVDCMTFSDMHDGEASAPSA